jgi:hypothetical protein
VLLLCVQQLRAGKQTGNVASAQICVQGPLYRDDSHDKQQLQETVIIQTISFTFIFLTVIYFFQSLGISVCVVACEIKILNISNFLYSLEFKKQDLKKIENN